MFDDSNKLMVGDNHTLTVEFSTDERIIGLYDNDSRRPEFEFIWDNVTRSADNITGTKDNFTATYTIKSGDMGFEKDIDYRIRLYDPAGNLKNIQTVRVWRTSCQELSDRYGQTFGQKCCIGSG